MTTVTLSTCEVEIKDALTWGDKERVKAAMIASYARSGEKDGSEAILEGKYRLLEVSVLGIKAKDGEKSVPFTREWMDALTIEDGDALYAKVDEVQTVKK